MSEQAFNLDSFLTDMTPSGSETGSAFEEELEFYTKLLEKLEVTKAHLKTELKKVLSPSDGFQETGMFFQLCLELRMAQECVEFFSVRKNSLQSIVDIKNRKAK